MNGIHQVSLMVLMSLLTLHVSCVPSPIMESCDMINPCSCLTDSGLVIDLSPLDSMNYLQPAFKDVAVIGNSTDKFSWNPCTPFCELHCENAAVCQVADPDGGLYYDTGKHVSAHFSLNYTSGHLNLPGLVLIYEDDQGDVPRTSILHLLCDEDSVDHELKPYGETAIHSVHYFFEVVSKYACPRNVSVSSGVQSPPALPTCPHPWLLTTATPKPTTTPVTTTEPPTTPTEPTTTSSPLTTTHSTTTASEVTSTDSAATSSTTTPTPATTAAPVSLTALWVVLSIAVIVLVAEAVFVIVLTVNLVKGRTGTMMLPCYRPDLCCKTDTDDRHAII